MGRVLQVFHDHATVDGAVLSDSFFGTEVAFRLSFQPLSLEELTRVWDALKEPYQLSVAYLVQFVDIDSARAATNIPFVERAETAIGAAS